MGGACWGARGGSAAQGTPPACVTEGSVNAGGSGAHRGLVLAAAQTKAGALAMSQDRGQQLPPKAREGRDITARDRRYDSKED